MRNTVPLFIFFALIVPFFISQTSGKNQIESLLHVHNTNANIDRSHFNTTNHFDDHLNIYLQDGLKDKDRIVKLPGQPEVMFNQYGGYVTVNETSGRAFYYYFVEAEGAQGKEMPLLLWLNGGPGCSSLGNGAMQELGPFRVSSDGKTLYTNKFAWNQAANVLFLESPAGVGFSYSNMTSDSQIGGDRQTAADNYAFLVNWLERFPEYKTRDFFISGESYAGHYVPELAHTILVHNQAAKRNVINLKGIIIGNALLNDETDTIGMYEYFASHALISDDTLDELKKLCNFSPSATTTPTELCKEAITVAANSTFDLYIFNIYAPLCHNSNLTIRPKKKTSVLDPDACSEHYVSAYLNRPDVQYAIHANITKLPYDWQPCSGLLQSWLDSPSTILPLLQELMTNGLRVWVFSGDTDGRIPVTSTKNSIKQMNLPLETPWYPWFLDGEVGGYTQVYKGNLTFATVRGAGHQVSTYQPARALFLIEHFLAGTNLPYSSLR